MEKVKDFVYGMEIDKEKSAGCFDYQGKTYHFCSERFQGALLNSFTSFSL